MLTFHEGLSLHTFGEIIPCSRKFLNFKLIIVTLKKINFRYASDSTAQQLYH